MPARDALHYQMILRDDLAPGGLLGALLDGFERSQRGMPMPSGKPSEIDAVASPVGLFSPRIPYDESRDGLRRYFAHGLEMSLPFYVDPRMTALVTAAAESMPIDAVLRPEDLPNSHGFLLLPSGLSQVDLRGQLMVHNAVCWFQRAGGVDLWFMSNKYDERDMINQKNLRYFGEEQMRDYPTLTAAIYTRLEFGQGVPMGIGGTKVLPPEITDQLRVVKDRASGSIAWSWPEGYDLNEWSGAYMEIAPDGPALWIMAMWRLMQQTIIDVRSEGVDRALRRAAERRKMKQNEVTVVTLRKRKRVEGEGPEQQIEWSHRWLVRGHWRQQWVGPRDGGPEERYQTPIWIHPHLKGPEDAPLLVRDHVYNLAR